MQGSKESSFREALVQSFQLAFSLRSISLGGGALPPSRRRSLFTVATSMIVFSSRTFNILPLVPIAKSSFDENTVDPFLCLVDDSKLRAVNPASGHLPIHYGSKEDDTAALKSLSAISLTENQSKASIVSVILNSLGDLSDSESSAMREQLLSDFLPDDVCPLGAQFVEAPGQILTFGPKKDYLSEEKVMSKSFALEDDVTEAFDSPPDTKPQLPIDSNLLGVNQLLESVQEIALGRLSVCTTPDVPFKEMASNCEALVVGKQQKMSAFMIVQQKQEICLSGLSEDHNVEQSSSLCTDDQFQMAGNPFLDENLNTYPQQTSLGLTLPCAAEMLSEYRYQYQYHQPEFLRLPASNPYDNFLKAAGC